MVKKGKSVPCSFCAKDIWVSPWTPKKKFCSHYCKSQSQSRKVEKVCFHCKKIFKIPPNRAKRDVKHFHCSYFCANQTHRGTDKKRITKVCFFCGDVFNVPPCQSFRKFCNHWCAVRGRRGTRRKKGSCPKEKESKT